MRISTKKKRKKRKEKKSSVFLLFCVSVGSFCDELTVVFRSFVRVRFLLIHKLLIGAGGVGGAGVCFLFPPLPGTDAAEEGPRGKKRPSSDRTKERKNDLHDGIKGEKKTDFSFVLFFFLLNRFFFLYICWFPKIQIFMVNGSSHNLFKMHCA